MAAFGEAAGIAGLVSLPGQTLQVLCSLYSFVKVYENTVPESHAVLRQIESLQDLMSQLDSRVIGVDDGNMSQGLRRLLTDRVGGCRETLAPMKAELSSVICGRRVLSLRRAKIAARREFTTMHTKLTAEHVSLSSTLNVAIYDLGQQNKQAIIDSSETLAIALQHTASRTMAELATIASAIQSTQKTVHDDIDGIQKTLGNVSDVSRQPVGPGAPTCTPCSSATHDCERPTRIVAPHILIDRILKKQLIFIDDPTFDSVNEKVRRARVRTLRGLRLMIWLLQDNKVSVFRNVPSTHRGQCLLIKEVHLYRVSYFPSDIVVRDASLSTRTIVYKVPTLLYDCTVILGHVFGHDKCQVVMILPWGCFYGYVDSAQVFDQEVLILRESDLVGLLDGDDDRPPVIFYQFM